MRFPLSFAAVAIVVASCSESGTSLVPACAVSPVCAGSPAEYDATPPSTCAPSSPSGEPSSPVDFGRSDLVATLSQMGSTAPVDVMTADDPRAGAALAGSAATLDTRAESFAVVPAGAGALVIGRDAVGAMYGAFELAERLRLGASVLPLAGPIVGAPAMSPRGYNPQIEMPENGEDCWYFLDASFWAGYLGELAHARIDWLDLYAVQSLQSERQVNALRYFATSSTFPYVGLPADKRARNVAMLSTIVQMAKVRGIQVSLLSGRSDLDPCGDDTSGTPFDCPLASDADVETYTREAVLDLATEVPGLWRIGVRLGNEGGEGAAFYQRTYVTALEAANGPGFYLRTWLSNHSDVETLTQSSPGGLIPLVEAKFSAEQVGPPYVPPNGNWFTKGSTSSVNGPSDWTSSYEYEDYLDGPEPFTFVFEIWNSASFKLFRYASAGRTRRALEAMRALSPRVAGFRVQAAHALESQRDFWHASPGDVYSPWTYARDELEPTLYGRLGYDPGTSDLALRAVLSARTGTDGFWDAEQAGSDVVARIVTAHGCGPDSRDFTPQLAWIGPVDYWASAPNGSASTFPNVSCVNDYHGPLDPFDVASPYEAAHDVVLGRATARVSPVDVALAVDADVATLRSAAAVAIDPSNPWARDVARECAALADLGDYFASKLRGATALAVFQATGASAWMDAARSETSVADAAWQRLADDTTYFADFTDGYLTNHVSQWSAQVPFLHGDTGALDAVAMAVTSQPPTFTGSLPVPAVWLRATRPSHPDAGLAVTPGDRTATAWTVTVALPDASPGTTVTVLWKPFASNADWTRVAASASGSGFVASIQGTKPGAVFAAEIVVPGLDAWRLPDPRVTVPYLSVPP